MTDQVVEAVRKDLLDRSQVGIKKYGVTLDRKDLSLKEWLQHAYEECLDQANYLKKCILEIEDWNYVKEQTKDRIEKWQKEQMREEILAEIANESQKNGLY